MDIAPCIKKRDKKKQSQKKRKGGGGDGGTVRVEIREGGERSSSFFLRSMGIGSSDLVRPRSKVHVLDEGLTRVSKTQDFVEDSCEEFGKSKVSGLGVSTGLPRIFYMLQEVGIFSYLV